LVSFFVVNYVKRDLLDPPGYKSGNRLVLITFRDYQDLEESPDFQGCKGSRATKVKLEKKDMLGRKETEVIVGCQDLQVWMVHVAPKVWTARQDLKDQKENLVLRDFKEFKVPSVQSDYQ
jgi:hypothetical protein